MLMKNLFSLNVIWKIKFVVVREIAKNNSIMNKCLSAVAISWVHQVSKCQVDQQHTQQQKKEHVSTR